MSEQKLKILHLGAGSAADTNAVVRSYFDEHEVTHFGEDPEVVKASPLRTFINLLKEYGVSHVISQIYRRARRAIRNTKSRAGQERIAAGSYRLIKWHYELGDRLPFDDNSYDAVYSEHFFEHLFHDEALELFREIFRVLVPNGVVRTTVPDPDLRMYLPPEPVGFPTNRMSFSSPSKHKTRWNVYSLKTILQCAGFTTNAVVWCDRHGIFHTTLHSKNYAADYSVPQLLKTEFLLRAEYVQREQSLIVDGCKDI